MRNSIRSIARLPISMAFACLVVNPVVVPPPPMFRISGGGKRDTQRLQNQLRFKNQMKVSIGLRNRTTHK